MRKTIIRLIASLVLVLCKLLSICACIVLRLLIENTQGELVNVLDIALVTWVTWVTKGYLFVMIIT